MKIKNKICKISAFTLAEVLITLGIIGIVAAMTIPTLMTKIQKRTPHSPCSSVSVFSYRCAMLAVAARISGFVSHPPLGFFLFSGRKTGKINSFL